MTKYIMLIALVVGVLIGSQAPQFSQQYYQRLSAAVVELRTVVDDFDSSARRLDLTREQALSEMRDNLSEFVTLREKDMRRTIARLDRLETNLSVFASQTDVARVTTLLTAPDAPLVRDTWEIFEPGVPLTQSAIAFAAFGGVVMALFAFGVSLVARPLFRRTVRSAQA